MSKIKILSESRALLAPLANTESAEATRVLNEAIEDASAVDGDRVLDRFEAEAVRTAFDQLTGTAGAPVTLQQAGEIKSALSLRVQEMKAERAKSTEAIFTSEGEALEVFRAKILGTLEDTIAKASGRPVDVNMMLFAFTDKQMADAVLEMARRNPNVTFRLLTDWSQMSSSGSRQAPRLARAAADEGLTNLQVKFKKDNPYIWDSRAGRPVFSHGHTKGLNHHKGFVTLIDGQPERMTFGSFNWSVGAMDSNYENLMLLDRKDPENRAIMEGYDKEFEAFWNNDEAALTYPEARAEKDRLYRALYEANGQPYTSASSGLGPVDDPLYVREDRNAAFDLNSFADEDAAQLEAVVGKTLARKIHKELRDYGRFDSWTELLTRVPAVASADTWVREQLMENLEYGDGGLSINSASVAALDRAGLSRRQAERVVAYREAHGAFESVDELRAISGIGEATVRRIKEAMSDDEALGTYSARVPGGAPTTGWSEDHHGTHAVPKRGALDEGPDAPVVPSNRMELEEVERNMAAPVIDLLRRAKPGQTFRLAMYGISTSSPEFEALREAIERGVTVRAVIYKPYNDRAVDALKRFRAEGYDVDVRTLRSRVMHEKFGVIGDDVFNGSANWSMSSITKHSEDRFLFRNEPDLAHRFVEEFARLWERGTEV